MFRGAPSDTAEGRIIGPSKIARSESLQFQEETDG